MRITLRCGKAVHHVTRMCNFAYNGPRPRGIGRTLTDLIGSHIVSLQYDFERLVLPELVYIVNTGEWWMAPDEGRVTRE